MVQEQRLPPRTIVAIPLIEVWIDEAERRVWFLYEAGRK
jgi:hypothetical protein